MVAKGFELVKSNIKLQSKIDNSNYSKSTKIDKEVELMEHAGYE